jgi:hypothetical protein
MLDQQDISYFIARADEEHELSEAAADPAVKQFHANLSKRYANIVARNSQPRPILHIVTG